LVQEALSPIDVKVALADTVTNPVKAHVDCLGTFLFDCVIGNSGSSAVVSLYGSGWLGIMSEFFKAGAKWACLFAIVEEGSKFSFGGAGYDFMEDLAQDVDCPIGRRWWVIRLRRLGMVAGATAEVMVPSSVGAGFGSREVRGIAFDVEDHITGMITYGCVGMGSTVGEEVG
jgi:hypothetical protein